MIEEPQSGQHHSLTLTLGKHRLPYLPPFKSVCGTGVHQYGKERGGSWENIEAGGATRGGGGVGGGKDLDNEAIEGNSKVEKACRKNAKMFSL